MSGCQSILPISFYHTFILLLYSNLFRDYLIVIYGIKTIYLKMLLKKITRKNRFNL